MAEQSLAELPKTTLLQKLQGQIAANKRAKNAAEQIGEKVQEVIGSATAAATGAVIGFSEVNWASEKGPLSLGPVELPLAVATAATALSFFGFNPAGQMTYVAAGAAGVYGAGRGRAYAIKRKEEQAKKKGLSPSTGWDDSDEGDDAERAFIDS